MPQLPLRIIFLGTPSFATIPLEALAHDPRYNLVGVITQPDRPLRRSGTPEPPPVKQTALRLGIPLLQPETLRDEAAVAAIADLNADLGVVAAYGEILRKNVLALPPHGYLNIHPSLLPRWRGPTPVAGAILAGDAETGVTVMKLDAKMDSGPILAQHREPLAADAQAGALTEALFHTGAQLLLDVIEPYTAGTLVPLAQDDVAATYTKLLTRADGEIDWNQPASLIERMPRAFDPWPGAFSSWRGQPLRILAARAHSDWRGEDAPGTLVTALPFAGVATSQGALELITVQPAGKRPMSAADWRRGLKDGNLRFGG